MAKKDEAAQSTTLDHITNLLTASSGIAIDWDDFSACIADREGAQMAAMKARVGEEKFFGCHAWLNIRFFFITNFRKVIIENHQKRTDLEPFFDQILKFYRFSSFLRAFGPKFIIFPEVPSDCFVQPWCHAHLALKSEKLVAEILQQEEIKASTSNMSLFPINPYTKSSTTKTATALHAIRKLLSDKHSNLTYNVSGDVTHDIKILSGGGDRFGALSVNACLMLSQRSKTIEYLDTISSTGIVDTVMTYLKTPWFWICLALYSVTGYEFTLFLMKKLNLKLDNKILTSFFGDERYVFDKEAKADSYNEITAWMKTFTTGYEFKNLCQNRDFFNIKTLPVGCPEAGQVGCRHK